MALADWLSQRTLGFLLITWISHHTNLWVISFTDIKLWKHRPSIFMSPWRGLKNGFNKLDMTFKVFWLFAERCSIIPTVMALEHEQSLMTVCFMWVLKIPAENSLYMKRWLLEIFTALSYLDQGHSSDGWAFYTLSWTISTNFRSMITF